MSAAKFTPGPWSISPERTDWVVAGRDAGRTLVAAAFSHGEKVSREVDANARLIAAAPELLAACEAMVKVLDDGLLVRDISRDHESDWAVRQLPLVRGIKQLTEAIAYARGELPHG